MDSILLISSDALTQLSWHTELQKKIYRILKASNESIALEILENETVDLIITDGSTDCEDDLNKTIRKYKNTLMIRTNKKDQKLKIASENRQLIEIIEEPVSLCSLASTASEMIYQSKVMQEKTKNVSARTKSLLADSQKLLSRAQQLSSEFHQLKEEYQHLVHSETAKSKKSPEIESLKNKISTIVENTKEQQLNLQKITMDPAIKEEQHKENEVYKLQFDLTKRFVRMGNKSLNNLTPKEFNILLLITSRPKQTIERNAIIETLWDKTTIAPRTVDVHLSRLRKKIKYLDIYIEFVAPYYYLQSPNLPFISYKTY